MPKKPFKFSDLVKMLPDGMWLHRKYDSYRNLAIVTLGENYNIMISSYNYPMSNPEDPDEKRINYRSFVNFKDKTEEEAEKLYQGMEKEIGEEIHPLEENLMEYLGDEYKKEDIEEIKASKEEIPEAKEAEIVDEEFKEEEDEDEDELFNENKINEIMEEMGRRKAKTKGSIIPLAVASSKKLTQNKFETNSPFDFKNAQKKSSGGDKKKKK